MLCHSEKQRGGNIKTSFPHTEISTMQLPFRLSASPRRERKREERKREREKGVSNNVCMRTCAKKVRVLNARVQRAP